MEEIDLRELFNIFWNKKYQILVTVLIFVIIGIVYTIGFKTPIYSASTTMVLAMADNNDSRSSDSSKDSITTTDITLNSKLVPTYSELIKSKKVLREVKKNLNIDDSEAKLKNNVSVSAKEGTEMIQIVVKHEDPATAAKIANETAKVFAEKINEIYKINNVYPVDEAETPSSPSNINHTKDVILFAFIGLALSAAYVFVLNMLDNTIKTSEDIEKGYGIPVLVSIPQIESFDLEKGGKK